jgi:integrase
MAQEVKKMWLKLNEQVIKSAALPERGYVLLRDGELPGFALRVMASGARSFVLCYTANGVGRRMTIGGWPAWTAAAAREHAKELRRRIDLGEDPLMEKQARRDAMTVSELAREYLERHAAKKKSGKVLAEYLRRDVLPAWGRWKAEDVRRRDVIELVEKKADRTPVAGNMLLGVIRAMYNWAIEKDLFEQNPAARVKPPAEKRPRERWLTEGEIRKVWTRLEAARMAPECRRALRLILITAQRPGEVLSMESTEVDRDADTWIIPAEKSKNGKQHTVPLSSLALETIAECEPGRWLFPGWNATGRHLSVAGLSNAAASNQAHFGIPRWTPHDLRRTAATWMVKSGVPRFIVERVLNHSDKSIGSVYDRHSYDTEKRAGLERWERELRRIIGRPAKAKVVELAR